METKKSIKGLAPLTCDNVEILVLGTFPGISSLEAEEYYYDNSNRMWKVLASLCNEKDVPSSYDDKKAMLANHKIALWDYYDTVVKSSNDSLDKSLIKNESNPNKIVEFLQRNPSIKVVAFNGKRNGKEFGKKIKGIGREIRVLGMPSTSGANTHYNLDKLVEEWRKII